MEHVSLDNVLLQLLYNAILFVIAGRLFQQHDTQLFLYTMKLYPLTLIHLIPPPLSLFTTYTVGY
jgi:hypothetical protein